MDEVGGRMTREQQARILLAKGYSCEQAIFGAFADLLGCSTIDAALMAPSRKERGRTCGAYTAGELLIGRAYGSEGREPQLRRAWQEKRQEQRRQKAAAAEDEFRTLFIGKFGTLDCKAIQGSREKGWGGMDGVVGVTVQLLERVLEKERL